MEVRIGITHTPKEIEVEPAGSADEVAAAVEAALSAGDGILWLTDRKGRRVGVPSARIAYVEIGSPHDDRRVGFGAP